MSQAHVTFTVRFIGIAITVIDIQGEVSAAIAEALTDAYKRASGATARVIILNFTNMTYMNSSGIGLIVTLLIQARRQHQHLFCYGLNEHYLHIFTLTRLSDAIKIYTSEEEAVADASRQSLSGF
jgi:anti-sigma B factor antagonist